MEQENSVTINLQQEQSNNSSETSAGQSVPSELFSANKNLIYDKTSKKLFYKYRYFDHIVIQDTENGLINAGKFIIDVATSQGKKTDIMDFKRTDDYQLCMEIQAKNKSPGNHGDQNNDGFIVYHEGYGNDVRGTYMPFKQFQLVALWVDKKHKLAVLDLLETINNKANALNTSAYDELKRLNDEMKQEIELMKSQIHDLTTPKNKLIPSYLYAKQYGNYFQLKYKQTNPENIKSNIKQIELINARDVKIDFIYHANKLGLIQNIKSKNLCKLEDIDIVFEMLGKLKNNTFDIHEYQNINDLIDAELTKLRSLPSTQQRKGKILELEYSRKNGTIPWMFTSSTILNRYNEIHLDSGIDFVKIDNENITTIGQVKMKNNTYIATSDIDTFLSKCKEDKFKDCNKELVLVNCKVSKKFKSKMSEYGINLNILSEHL